MTTAAPLRPGPLFDTIAIVDWSAAAKPTPKKPSADAIWIGVCQAGRAQPARYCRTRAEAVRALEALIATGRRAGHRLLIGFDFPFGYPTGFAETITGRPEALALWQHLATIIEDHENNANNRFAVAAALNARFDGVGPFWGCPPSLTVPGLPARGSARHGTHPPERRCAERLLRRAQPCWKLFTTGSVGSQALLGIAALSGLRARTRAAVWPFDTGLVVPDAPVVLAEIFPSLIDGTIRAAQHAGEIRDAAQVRVLAGALARMDQSGDLARLFAVPSLTDATLRTQVAREEGWILGLGHAEALEAAWAR